MLQWEHFPHLIRTGYDTDVFQRDFKRPSHSQAAWDAKWSTCSAKSPPSQLFCSPQPSPLWLCGEALACILYNGFCSAHSFHRQKARLGGFLHLALQWTPTLYPPHREHHATTSVVSTCPVSPASSIATLRHHFHLNSISVFPCPIFGLSEPHTRHVLPGLWLAISNLIKQETVGSIWHQTPFYTHFLTDGNSWFLQALWQTVALAVNHMIHFKFLFKI